METLYFIGFIAAMLPLAFLAGYVFGTILLAIVCGGWKFWNRKRITQFFCNHNWECVQGYELTTPKPPLFRCRKCGKEEGLK
jgi:ABC-type phosphate transport system permease subunit